MLGFMVGSHVLEAQIVTLPQCIGPQISLLLPLSLYPIVRLIRFITHKKYAFLYFNLLDQIVKPDKITLTSWIQIDHILL